LTSSRWFVALAALSAALLPAIHAQAPTPQKNAAAEWPMYNRDLGGTRFSPLTQINSRNVGRLTRAWTYKVGKVKAEGITGGRSSRRLW
jgi:quinoprotein glucose dehydrogenase